MEQVSGQDLGWFFRQWIYRAGSPVLEGRWQYDTATHKIKLELTQTQSSDPYRLPVEISFAPAGAPPKFATLQVTAREQHFEISSDRNPASVEIDPNTALLAQTNFARQ